MLDSLDSIVEPHAFAAFMLGAIALNLTPGPDMIYVLSQGAARGTRAAMAAALGVGAGTVVHILLAAAGLAVLLAEYPLAFDIVRYLGAAYLVWIAISLFRAGPMALTPPTATAVFRQGALTNILNPKVALFFLAFLPQFMRSHGAPFWQQCLLLGLAFDISGTAVNCAVAAFSGKLAERLCRNYRLARGLNWIAGGIMSGLAVRLVLERAK